MRFGGDRRHHVSRSGQRLGVDQTPFRHGSTGACWVANRMQRSVSFGSGGRATLRPPRPSSAEGSTRPDARPSTWSPTRLRSTPSAIRACARDAEHTATGFYNLVISTNRCQRNHGYVKSRIRPMRGLKRFAFAMRLFPALDALQTGRAWLRARTAHRSAVHRWTQLSTVRCETSMPRSASSSRICRLASG
jgi:hypothetical protein